MDKLMTLGRCGLLVIDLDPTRLSPHRVNMATEGLNVMSSLLQLPLERADEDLIISPGGLDVHPPSPAAECGPPRRM